MDGCKYMLKNNLLLFSELSWFKSSPTLRLAIIALGTTITWIPVAPPSPNGLGFFYVIRRTESIQFFPSVIERIRHWVAIKVYYCIIKKLAFEKQSNRRFTSKKVSSKYLCPESVLLVIFRSHFEILIVAKAFIKLVHACHSKSHHAHWHFKF